MKNEKGFSLLEVVIACMVLMIVASAVIPSAWKFYRQAAVEYEAEHLLSDLRRAQSISRLTMEVAGASGMKQPRALLMIGLTESQMFVGNKQIESHRYWPQVHVQKKDTDSSMQRISFQNNGAVYGTDVMTLCIFYTGYANEGQQIIVSKSGRIRIKRGQ